MYASILLFFVNSPPTKSQIVQLTRKILKLLSLRPPYLLKITKFLVKTSQFEFLVMTEKNIFAYKLLLSFNISYFNFATLLKKDHPLFPSNPPLNS